MSEAQVGDRVRIQYSPVLKEGTAASEPRTPKELEFTVGASKVMRGLSSGILGMNQGDQKRLTLQPADAFGVVQPRLIREIPRRRLSTKRELKLGMRLTAKSLASGTRRRVRVVEINPLSVLVDGNHPQAGRVIDWDVMLLSVDSSSEANRTKPQVDTGGES